MKTLTRTAAKGESMATPSNWLQNLLLKENESVMQQEGNFF